MEQLVNNELGRCGRVQYWPNFTLGWTEQNNEYPRLRFEKGIFEVRVKIILLSDSTLQSTVYTEESLHMNFVLVRC
jgi:hypothetical protein